MSRLTATCPAKVNLGLEITGRRPDGYHDIVTIFQALALGDEVSVEPAADLTLNCADPSLATPDNLCLRAAAALRQMTGSVAGARIHLVKRIPAAAGLGGGSSNAAQTLRLLNRLWRLDLDAAALASVAVQLGADVPFFLTGPTALATGIGEKLEVLPPPASLWLVLARPALEVPGKTAQLYRALTPADWSDGAATRAQAARLRAGLGLERGLLRNAFARPLRTLFPAVGELDGELRRAGASLVFPAGSGPTLVGVCEDVQTAEAVAATVEMPGRWVLVTHTLTAGTN